jgi:cytochrome b561
MQLRNSVESYGAVARTFHWLTVVLVLLGWMLGQFGDVFPRGPARAAGLFVHMSAGLTVVTLLVFRLLWRFGNPRPPAEVTPLGVWGDRAATFAHWLLYALLLATPIAGIVLQFARGNPVPIFGLFAIASPWAADRAFARSVAGVHETLANALVILALLHGAAALFHHFVFRDRTLKRMLGAA